MISKKQAKIFTCLIKKYPFLLKIGKKSYTKICLYIINQASCILVLFYFK